MGEIVHIHVGKAGNQIGSKFFEVVCGEHGIDSEGTYVGKSELELEKINVHFLESNGGKYVPRAVLTDLESEALDSVKGCRFGKLFNPDNFIEGCFGSGGNWGIGHWTYGSELVDKVVETVRSEIEKCDKFHGFQVSHSLGGGAGSGFGSLIVEKLRENYPCEIMMCCSVFPSPDISSNVIEPYNAIMGIHWFIENSDLVMCFDNAALCDISFRTLNLKKPTIGDMNHLIATMMSDVTCSMRFPGTINTDLRKLGTNLIPFPRLHFFDLGFAPLFPKSLEEKDKYCFTVDDIKKTLFAPKNRSCSIDVHSGKYFTAAAIFRGKVPTSEVEEYMNNMQEKNSDHFCEWIPKNIQTCICNVPPKGVNVSATRISNNSAIKGLINSVRQKFNKLMKRKAFLHYFLGGG